MVLSLESIIKASLISNNQPIQQYIQNNSSTIYTLIDNEFKKDFIKKLYPNPKWTERVYWNVIGKIQNEHEDISLDDIISETDNHLMANNLRPSTMSQRDTIKFIHDTILHLQTDNNATITTISSLAIEAGIPIDKLESAIKRMKADGSIFEPVEGHYKLI